MNRTIHTTFYRPSADHQPTFPTVNVGEIEGHVTLGGYGALNWSAKYDDDTHRHGWTLHVTAAEFRPWWRLWRPVWRVMSARMERTAV